MTKHRVIHIHRNSVLHFHRARQLLLAASYYGSYHVENISLVRVSSLTKSNKCVV
jgi:hypothetical protein